jgi:hypothetical protein
VIWLQICRVSHRSRPAQALGAGWFGRVMWHRRVITAARRAVLRGERDRSS